MGMTTVQHKKGALRISLFACFIGLLGIVLLLPSAASADEERPEIIVPRASGRDLFQACVLCHKYDGRGGASEGGYAADLQKTKLTREEIIVVIANGRVDKGMPSFQGILDDYKIKTIATFIKEELKAKE